MRACILALMMFLVLPVYGQQTGEQLLNSITFTQRVNEQVPLNAAFHDEMNADVFLSHYFGKRPVVLVMGYYECPMLCSMVHQELVQTLNQIDLQPGVDYELVSVSIDPTEVAETARLQRNTLAKRFTRADATDGFHFLVGTEEEIRRVADAIGFNFTYDAASGQYAHAAGFVVVTPSGRIHRYFYGVEYEPGEIKTALFNASREEKGTSVREIILRCFHYDPVTGRFGPAIMNTLRVASILTLIALGYMLYRSRPETETRLAKKAESTHV